MNIHIVRQAAHALRDLIEAPENDPVALPKFLSLWNALHEELQSGPETRVEYRPKEIGEEESTIAFKLLAVADMYLAVYIGSENVTGRKVRVFFSDGLILEGTAHESVEDIVTLGGCVAINADGTLLEDSPILPVQRVNLRTQTVERFELVPNEPVENIEQVEPAPAEPAPNEPDAEHE